MDSAATSPSSKLEKLGTFCFFCVGRPAGPLNSPSRSDTASDNRTKSDLSELITVSVFSPLSTLPVSEIEEVKHPATYSGNVPLSTHLITTTMRHAELTLPDGDVLIHPGDFTDSGEELEKVVIAGNHERTFDIPYYCEQDRRRRLDEGLDVYARRVKAILDNERLRSEHGIVYLEDAKFSLPDPAGGEITVWGHPWQPAYANFAFNLPRDGPELREVVRNIPAEIDILVTHGPPFGMLDVAFRGKSFGCSFLAERLLAPTLMERLQNWFFADAGRETLPTCDAQVHVFGHIHSGYGTKMFQRTSLYQCKPLRRKRQGLECPNHL
ncbi:uncharacterized protein EV422DRAFT_507807 [Fimicolochytrium jonesii]|uniref:uncharacterized protein n=1 Tax=Fimicolochytrium jonesii TaxID=1396493 RepID=UPI0022FE9F31|nr:uncharacterized protein EV422DRAFT_507807 [Fimicolochytrium jonesii]KAI8818993.1 hypothetical protein EV422DRAFT_507807 [Fimicolochytrium jonesii]